MPKIQLLTFSGCPNAGAARRRLTRALAGIAPNGGFQEIDIEAEDCPAELRRWGSPTILVDGRDVEDGEPGEELACRIYPANRGAPDEAAIAAAIRNARAGTEK